MSSTDDNRSEGRGASRLRIAWCGAIPGEGGVGGAARDILSGLLALGHEVDCYLAGQPQCLPAECTRFPSFTVHWSGSRWRWNRWYSKDPVCTFLTGTVARAIGMRRLGSAMVRAHRTHPYDVVYQFSNIEILGFRRHLADLPPLVIHPETHMAGELRWYAKEWHLVSRCSTFGRRHAVKMALRLRVIAQRRDIRKATTVICISDIFRRHLIEDYGLSAARTVVVPNPVRAESFAPHSEGQAVGPVVILFVGRIALRKGIDMLVELSRRLGDLRGAARLEIVGGTSLWSDYRNLLEDLDSSVATYHGGVPPGGVVDHLRGADLLIQPSKYEPFGLTLGEGLASGLPVVATDAVGAAENVARECCTVVPAGDMHQFESAVRDMVSKVRGPDRLGMRQVAQREARRLFNPQEVSQMIAGVLTRAASTQHSAPVVDAGQGAALPSREKVLWGFKVQIPPSLSRVVPSRRFYAAVLSLPSRFADRDAGLVSAPTDFRDGPPSGSRARG